MKPVVVIGSINMDNVLGVAEIPLAGETVLARSSERFAGGKGANQAVAAARLGADVRFIGRVGEDDAGDFMLDSLKSSGVDTEYVERTKGAGTGTAYICVSDEGENCIVVNQGANALVDAEQLIRCEKAISDAAFCVFQLEIPLETVFAGIRRAAALGVKTVLNPSPSAPVPDEILSLVNLLIVNGAEYAYLAGDGDPVEFVREKGIEQMIITLGGDGLKYVTANGTAEYRAQRAKAVDTTGAGDCFLGALVAMLAEGRETDEAIKIAMRASAIAVTREGAQRAMPYRHEIGDI